MYVLRFVTAIALLFFQTFLTFGQNTPAVKGSIGGDTLAVAAPSDTTKAQDSIKVKENKSDIEETILYSSKDSIFFNTANKVLFLYGKSKVKYGDINLESDKIEVNWNTNTMTATGSIDTSGTYFGKPNFSQRDDKFQADTIRYNIVSKKGIITKVVTQEGEGYIHADKGQKDAHDNFYFNSAKYTTCNLEQPHFHIQARKLKMIPDDKVVSGPFNLHISDIPTPIGFFLGFFPMPEKRASGIIFPNNYGQHNTRGLFFTQGGYYFAIKDYAGLALKGDLYANGSWKGTMESSYKNRYKYGGKMAFNYAKLKDGFETDSLHEFVPQFQLNWRHTSESKGNTRFNANVDVVSNGFYKNISYNPANIYTANSTSGIQYSHSFRNTPLSLNVAANLSQNLVKKTSDLTLPGITFAATTFYPLRSKTNPKNNWIQNINMGYTLNTEFNVKNYPTPQSKVIETENEFDTVAFTPANINRLINRAQYGATHSIPIGTTFKAKKTFLKYFNVSPSVQYNEYWFTQKYNYSFQKAGKGEQIIDTLYSREFARASDYSATVSVNTWVYGTAKFKKGKIAALRHSMNPVVGMTYKPDFSDPDFGTSFIKYTDTSGRQQTISKYNTFMGGPSAGESRSLNYSLANQLQAKIKTKDTANPFKKVILLDQFGFNGNYNFAADSFQFSPINLYANTRLFSIFDIRFTGTLDPYTYTNDSIRLSKTQSEKAYLIYYQKRKNTLAISDNGSLGSIINTSLNLGATFSPQMFKRKKKEEVEAEEKKKKMKAQNLDPNLYVDFNIPWSLSFQYIYNLNKQPNNPRIPNKTLRVNGDLKLTENWKVTYAVNYDIENAGFTASTLQIHRDLHCWQMSASVNLFSAQQSYMFMLSPKAGILQDLKLNKRSQYSMGNSLY